MSVMQGSKDEGPFYFVLAVSPEGRSNADVLAAREREGFRVFEVLWGNQSPRTADGKTHVATLRGKRPYPAPPEDPLEKWRRLHEKVVPLTMGARPREAAVTELGELALEEASFFHATRVILEVRPALDEALEACRRIHLVLVDAVEAQVNMAKLEERVRTLKEAAIAACRIVEEVQVKNGLLERGA